MQTILGAGGVIGNETAKALAGFTQSIRLVGRNPEKVNETDEIFTADLKEADQALKAVQGSEIAYLTVGLPYSSRIWMADWPVIVSNVIDACKKHNTCLVFFDNIYMYHPNSVWYMAEDTPCRPVSKKGMVRDSIARMIMDEVGRGQLTALIARSADFYGPSIRDTSILTETVFKPLAAGKTASWLMSPDHRHSFTFTPDAGKATALLGNRPEAFNRIWHLPTAGDPFTGREWIELIANELEVKPKSRILSRSMVKTLGLFMPVMRETVEMLYQYDRDYVFDSSDFEETFNFRPTPYKDGIRQIVKQNYSRN